MLFLGLFTVWQALQVRAALNDVAVRMSSIGRAMAVGRTGQVTENVDAAGDSARKAQRYTRGPVWWGASKLPWVGDDVTAVRTVADVADDLTEDTLPDLVEAGSSFGPTVLEPKRGRIDLSGIPAVTPALEQGASEIADSAARVNDLDTSGLVPQVRASVVEVQDKLTTASAVAGQAATAARLMPPMLGAKQPRTYLLMFQNNAEIRAQGGMPGAVAVLTARNGRLHMTRQSRPAEIGTFPDPFVRLTGEERALFTERLGVYPQDVSFVPDFARSSQILSQMWERTQPEHLDGVISVDPVAMSYLLKGTGPITLAGGQTLNAGNAADYLMRDVYLRVADPEAQNTLFADAARRVFDGLLGKVNNPRGLLAGLSQAATERRLMMWSARPGEQKQISDTAIAGVLPGEGSGRPEVGVYVNDSSADKLSYYLDYDVDVDARSCSPEGAQSLDVHLTATSKVPKGAVLPPSVVGPSTNPVPPGVLLHSFYVYAPPGGYLQSATTDGEDAPLSEYTYRGRSVGAITLDLQPGQTRTVDFEIRSGPGETGDPRLVTTPGAQGTGHGKVSATAC